MDAVRDGDANAFDAVYRRHVDAARRLARILARDHAEADDLVAEAFARLLGTLKSGGGPESAVRAYVLTTIRRVHIDRGRSGSRVEPVEDVADYERPETPDDPALAKLDQTYAARAFAGLPERWQAVLWHTEVEGESAAQVAPLLGLNPNAVSAIAYRARERLRQLYLQQHLAAAEAKECRWVTERLGAYVRDKLAARESGRVQQHLDDCDRCRVVYLDLVEVNAGFRSVLAPIVLGAAAAPYLAGASGTLLGFIPAVAGWARRSVRNPAASAVAAVALVALLGVGAWAAVSNSHILSQEPSRHGGNSGGPTGGPASGSASSQPTSASSAPTQPPSTKPPATHSTKPAAQTSLPSTSTQPTSRPSPTASRQPPQPTHSQQPQSHSHKPPPHTQQPPSHTQKPQPTHSSPPSTSNPTPTASSSPTRKPTCVRVLVLGLCVGGG
ncbi:MAG: sigma-70 family RNA polymerase sigma factor [Streptosporangiales bacterium]|nr:sigma-70 family RNA polymerase sigma factor [Streptosporangiales bacterium]MBO0891106.1 sigma-70 family RNA polymerase sigma factor [Acidothermales bacterium]